MLDTPRSKVAWEYWLPTPFASFPFISPPVRHRVPPGSERALPVLFIDRDIGYPDFWCSLFASIPPGKCRCGMWIRLRRLPSKFLHNLPFINHPPSQALWPDIPITSQTSKSAWFCLFRMKAVLFWTSCVESISLVNKQKFYEKFNRPSWSHIFRPEHC